MRGGHERATMRRREWRGEWRREWTTGRPLSIGELTELEKNKGQMAVGVAAGFDGRLLAGHFVPHGFWAKGLDNLEMGKAKTAIQRHLN
jgi:hypothetical protein